MSFRRIITVLAGCLVAGGVLSYGCNQDDPAKPEPPAAVEFKDLTQKDDVLFNLELSYNERVINQYDKLLDDDFVFYFSRFDVDNNGTPEYWDRTTDVVVTEKILDGDRVNALSLVKLNLDYPDTSWTEVSAPPSHEGETWYRQTIGYDFKVQTRTGWEFRAHDKYVEITIRWDDTLKHWRIVRMRDGAPPQAPGALSPAGIAPVYWGTFKAQLHR